MEIIWKKGRKLQYPYSTITGTSSLPITSQTDLFLFNSMAIMHVQVAVPCHLSYFIKFHTGFLHVLLYFCNALTSWWTRQPFKNRIVFM